METLSAVVMRTFIWVSKMICSRLEALRLSNMGTEMNLQKGRGEIQSKRKTDRSGKKGRHVPIAIAGLLGNHPLGAGNGENANHRTLGDAMSLEEAGAKVGDPVKDTAVALPEKGVLRVTAHHPLSEAVPLRLLLHPDFEVLKHGLCPGRQGGDELFLGKHRVASLGKTRCFVENFRRLKR